VATDAGAEESSAVTPDAGDATTPATTPAPPPSLTGGSIGSLKDGYAANEAEDLESAC
jgi:hypothetical protein